MARYIDHYPQAFPEGWWNHPPFTLDPDGALVTVPVPTYDDVPTRALVTLLGGPNGWDQIVRIEAAITTAEGDWAPEVEFSQDPEHVRWFWASDYRRAPAEHLPLWSWTPRALDDLARWAQAALEGTDAMYRIGKALRESRVLPSGEISAPLAEVQAIPSAVFANIFKIVSERHSYGYAEIMANMLGMNPQSVRNKVTRLRKQGLIEPATSRGNT